MAKATTSEKSALLKFRIKQEALKRELGFISGVVEKKSSIPLLQNIYIESVGLNSVRIVGTNLDVTVRCEADAEIIEMGEMCINAQKLFDIVRLLESGDLHFEKQPNEWVKLTCGESKFKFAGIDPDQFPEKALHKAVPLKLPAKTFHHFINNTAFAITQEQSKYTLSGAKFLIDGLTAMMVTTDGHRLALAEKALGAPLGDRMDVLIPKLALAELVKISADSDSDVAFGEDTNHIYFEIDGRLVMARKLTGKFPNYERVLPKNSDKLVSFEADLFRRALRRVALMSGGDARPVTLVIRPGEIELSAKSTEEGEGVEKIPADYDGVETTIGFQYKYIDDVLGLPVTTAATDGQKASLAFENGNLHVLFTTENDADFKYVIVPYRV